MRLRMVLFALGACCLFLLIGCGGGKPTCADADLVAPVLSSPAMWGTVGSLTPTLTWTYPDASCDPQGYRIYLRTGPFFADDLGGGTGNPSTSWSPGDPLEPGRGYSWGVQAVNGSHLGPYAGDRQFFTPPDCTSGDLTIPELLVPANNAVISDLGSLSLIWWYPDACLPDSYRIRLSASPDLDGSPLNGSTGNPSTRWGPGDPLTDCTRYYWDVAAYKDGLGGQYSELRTFRVDLTGACAPESGSGMIRGTVWQDQCALPDGPLPDPLPLGCVPDGGGSATANGTYDPGEPGIAGAVVSLAQGACPSATILREVPTYSMGTYSFFWVAPGTYCVGVDAMEPINIDTLIPGTWTSPATTESLTTRTVTVASGEDANNVDFGWWYQFGSGWGDVNASVYGMVWHDLCSMVPTDSPPAGPLPSGCALDAWGVVHADAVRQVSEPGIPGVNVTIGPGDCPSAGLANTLTDADGYYHFDHLAPGKYCLRIDPEEAGNAPILMPGSWTVIPSGHEGMTFRAVTLGQSGTLPGQDFGWDYDNFPLLAQFPYLTLAINANCRHGPGENYDISTHGMAGQSYHIDGRSEDGNWFYVRFDDSLQCWMAGSGGTAWGELGNVPVMQGPELPAFNCSQFTNNQTCSAHPECTWTHSQAATANIWYCKNK